MDRQGTWALVMAEALGWCQAVALDLGLAEQVLSLEQLAQELFLVLFLAQLLVS